MNQINIRYFIFHSLLTKEIILYPINKLINCIKKYYSIIYWSKISDACFLEKIGGVRNLFTEKMTFFIRSEEKSEVVDIIRSKYPDSINEVIGDANDICDHVFDLLGSGKTPLGREINWHEDFKSGFQWDPNKYYINNSSYLSDYFNKNIYADVKVPWELSRCQHFITLGKAYWYTNNEKYLTEFVSQVENWIEENPTELGVNWACTMDVSIRAVNFIWGYYFFMDSKALTVEFKIKFFKCLFLHGRHIFNNLEYGQIRGNHYISDLVGLVYLGIVFDNSKEGKEWLNKGVNELIKEISHQVYEDGVDFEGSINYHRLVTELFLSSTLISLQNKIMFPEQYMNRLENMIEFVMYYTKPDGSAPMIGDNDDGRLHILSNYGNWSKIDHRYLLSIGAVLFKRKDFKNLSGGFHEEAFWILGNDGLDFFNSL